jgi:hypothetical protein
MIYFFNYDQIAEHYLLLYSPLIFYTFGRTPWRGGSGRRKALPAHRTAQTQNKRTQISTPQVGFEPTIPVFKRAKTVPVLYRAAGHGDRRRRTLRVGNTRNQPAHISVAAHLGSQRNFDISRIWTSVI